jgi:hypothetical protein
VVCCVGCASKNKGKIEGTKWSNNASTLNGVPLPANVITLEFTADNKLIMKNPKESYTGTYSLGWGDNVTFNFDRELEGHKSHLEKITVEGDTLTMSDKTGTLSFKKVK